MNYRALNFPTKKFILSVTFHRDIQIVSKYGQEIITASYRGMKVPSPHNFSDTLISMSSRVSVDVYVDDAYDC